jgi:hypothetical protein
MKIVNEAVGVSEDAFIVAKRLLPMILDDIKLIKGVITDYSETFIYDFDYTIRVGKKTIPLKTIEVVLAFEKTNNRSKIDGKNILNTGLTFHTPDAKSITKKGLITYDSSDYAKISFEFVINDLATYSDLFKELRNYAEYIPSLAHEIKHFIDATVVGGDTGDLADMMKYKISTSLIEANVPVTDFIYQMYYIHKIENLVRPTQLYAQFMTEKVTKKDFLQKYTSSEIYKVLSGINDVTYENLVDMTAKDMGLPNMFMTKMFLEAYLNDLIDAFAKKGIQGIEFEMKKNGHDITRDDDDIKKIFINYIKNKVKIKKDSTGDNNIEETFNALINDMKYVAKNLKKKLAKIYSLMPD